MRETVHVLHLRGVPAESVRRIKILAANDRRTIKAAVLHLIDEEWDRRQQAGTLPEM